MAGTGLFSNGSGRFPPHGRISDTFKPSEDASVTFLNAMASIRGSLPNFNAGDELTTSRIFSPGLNDITRGSNCLNSNLPERRDHVLIFCPLRKTSTVLGYRIDTISPRIVSSVFLPTTMRILPCPPLQLSQSAPVYSVGYQPSEKVTKQFSSYFTRLSEGPNSILASVTPSSRER